ncbi:extensin family protein, partial [Mesorhizobium sp. M8A.F.Ca.ET.218.01.1.1]|uniref:extensin family protein n=1 Tax=Mesorhizobium sp. M8A.F.Ca.ET.218.01.1.1 TaxID=2563971 RepID=UPI001FE0A48C
VEFDAHDVELNNGDDIDVRKPGLFAFRTRGFLNNVRADGCQYFTTVLGPGYNARAPRSSPSATAIRNGCASSAISSA